MRRIKEKQLILSLSGSFTGSFSGSFIGDGSQLINVPLSAITGLELFRISTGSISASVSNTTDDLFKINDATNDIFIVKNTGVVVLQEQLTFPTSIAGGIMYSGSNFWVGIE